MSHTPPENPDQPQTPDAANDPSPADVENLAAALEAQANGDEVLSGGTFEDPDAASMTATSSRGSGGANGAGRVGGVGGVEMPNFEKVLQEVQASGIDLLKDVNLEVKIELGRSRLLVEDVLKLAEGSVVELDKLAGDPVDVFVNDRLVARGEVLVLNENFCVRVNEIVQNSREEFL